LTALHQQIRRTIRRHRLLPPGTRVLIALSGGSDSVALVHVLRDLAEREEFSVVGLAHLNHRLRPTAGRDEQFCRALAGRLPLPIAVEELDVPAYAVSQRLSIEDAARRLRYDFLARSAARIGADRVAVGHTQDDQAETFLLKLIRGAGLTGLGGIYPRKGLVVRPLLDVSRAELRAFLSAQGQPWLEDETNEDLENPRNRVRHVVLPELDRVYGGPVRGAIARSTDLIREDALWLDQVSASVFEEIVTRNADGIELESRRLAAEPPPIVRRVLLMALKAIAVDREVGLDHVLAAAEVLAGACGSMDVPGGRVELRRGNLVLSGQGPRRSDTLIES
jgi:tRNA(Ile)-lysidine synthase